MHRKVSRNWKLLVTLDRVDSNRQSFLDLVYEDLWARSDIKGRDKTLSLAGDRV